MLNLFFLCFVVVVPEIHGVTCLFCWWKQHAHCIFSLNFRAFLDGSSLKGWRELRHIYHMAIYPFSFVLPLLNFWYCPLPLSCVYNITMEINTYCLSISCNFLCFKFSIKLIMRGMLHFLALKILFCYNAASIFKHLNFIGSEFRLVVPMLFI